MALYFDVVPEYTPFDSNKEKQLYEHMRTAGAVPPDFEDMIMDLTSNRERVEIMYRRLERNLLCVNDNAKNDNTAIEMQTDGDECCGDKKYEDAVKYYTKSIAHAWNEEIKAEGYLKRSEILFRWNMVKECKEDVKRAQELSSNEELLSKLAKIENEAQNREEFQESNHEPIPTIPPEERHPRIPSASNCLNIVNNAVYGSHFIATRDIQIGEVLMVEKPFACVAFEENTFHCHECLELCFNPIPCDVCTQALYCSESCKTNADLYHRYECIVKTKLKDYKLSKADFLPIKIAILTTRDIYNESNMVSREGTRQIINMLHDTTKIDKRELTARVLRGAIIYYILKEHTSFFDVVHAQDFTHFFKEMIVKARGICNINAKEITETTNTIPGSSRYQPVSFGKGLYCSGRYFNHSCCPNVGVWSYGSTLVFRAMATIQEGQQCFVSYGPHHDLYETNIRQKILSTKYLFTCRCRACVDDWLVYREVPGNQEQGSALLSLMTESNVEDARTSLDQYVEQLREVESEAPSPNFTFAQAVLDHCFRAFGNTRRKRKYQ